MKLNKILLFGFLFVLTCQVSLAQTVVGKWKTYDIFNRNKEESIRSQFEEQRNFQE